VGIEVANFQICEAMKPYTGSLLTYLNGLRNQPDVVLLMADCFTFTTPSGVVLRYTNVDVPIVLGDVTFFSNSILIDGLKYKCATGLEIDTQQITISAKITDTDSQSNDVYVPPNIFAVPNAFAIQTSGSAFLIALRGMFFDGCQIQRDRVFFSDYIGGTQQGSVTLFKGRLATVDEVGRTTAKITVQSDLVFLDLQFPRNIWQLTCLHVLYDTGCTLNKALFAANGTVGAGSTPTTINWSGAALVKQQGRILFTSGANNGQSATVGVVKPGVSMQLRYPLPNLPAVGDAFTVYHGCDHAQATCAATFDNAINFRGFPFTPPAEMSV
jgi:uncharacterized phage protein (TIGR02218 family)